LKFKFECKVCGECCKHYRIIINFADALRICNAIDEIKFLEKFSFVKETELLNSDDLIYKSFYINENGYQLAIINNKETGCVFQTNKKCSIHNFKPGVCYFYPLRLKNDNEFEVIKYDVCNGDFNNKFSEWTDLEFKLKQYQNESIWHNEIVDFWNQYYSKTATDIKDFIIFFYESLRPLFDKYQKQLISN